MTEVAKLIADMVRAGVDPDLIGRAAAAIAESSIPSTPVRTARQERNARYYRRLDVTQDEWAALRTAVFARDGYRCVYCGDDVHGAPQCDHKTPLVLGGASVIENLATACKPCNSAKSGLSFEGWQAICR